MSDDNDDKGGGDDALKKVLAKNEEILGELKTARQKLRDFEAAEAERKAEIARKEEDEARAKGDFQKLLDAEKKRSEEKEGEALLYRAKYEEREIELGLKESLTSAGVKPELMKAVSTMLKSEAEIGESGVSLRGKPLADAIKEWASSDEGKAFVSNGNEGGGATGGSKDTGKGGAKTVSRASFDKMDTGQRADFIKSGGKVTDPTG
jgi:hypothetical protein